MMEKLKNKVKTLKYKGYFGSVEFSEEDNLLFGEILGINGLVNFEGKTMQELTDSFHVRIAPDTHREIANLAAEAGISINAFVKRALAEAVKHPWEEPEGPRYGTRDTLQLTLPQKDVAFAKNLAKRMGWELHK